jgi:Flp pilus assembly protein TadG
MTDEKVVEEVRVLKRGGGAAIVWGFLAFVISLIALITALHAQAKVNNATERANSAIQKVDKLSNHVDNALGKQSTTGNSVNGATTTGGNNPVPTANGQ